MKMIFTMNYWSGGIIFKCKRQKHYKLVIQLTTFLVKTFSDEEFFNITGPEYDKLSLYKIVLGFGMAKFWLETDRNEVSGKVSARN